jgi:outer membrane protein assembly factor BamB
MDRKADLFCLDASTGKLVWGKDLQKEFGVKMPNWAFAGSPLLLEDMVVVDVGKILAFEPASGKLLWQTDDYGSAYSTPMVFNNNGRRLLAALPKPGLVVLDAKSGKQLATYPWQTSYGVNAATPLVVDDLIMVTTGYNTGIVAVRLEGDKLVRAWQSRAMASQLATPVAIDGNLYGFNEGVLTCLELASGKPRWTERGLGKGSLIGAEGKLVILSERGELVIADASPEGFKALQRVKAITDGSNCWVAPVADSGRIYCRGPLGQLVCLQTDGS